MYRIATFISDIFFAFLVILAFTFWLIHLGYPATEVAFIITLATTTIVIGSVFRWRNMQRASDAQLDRRFSRRNMLKNLGVAAGFLVVTAAEGWGWETIAFQAGLIFGLGSLALLMDWLIKRKYSP